MKTELINSIASECTEQLSDWNPVRGNYTETSFDKEQFAHMILLEVFEILERHNHLKAIRNQLSAYNEGWINGRLLAVEQIKDRFGLDNQLHDWE